MVPAIPGVALFLYQMYEVNKARMANGSGLGDINFEIRGALDTPLSVLYCIFLAIWATVMMEVWKRTEYELAHIWNMKDYMGNDAERKDFKYELVIDPTSKDFKKKSFISSYMRRLLIELPTLIVAIGAVVGVYIGYTVYLKGHHTSIESLISAIIYAIIIVVFGAIYKEIAKVFSGWENHRYE
jgi:hypothetical protein